MAINAQRRATCEEFHERHPCAPHVDGLCLRVGVPEDFGCHIVERSCETRGLFRDPGRPPEVAGHQRAITSKQYLFVLSPCQVATRLGLCVVEKGTTSAQIHACENVARFLNNIEITRDDAARIRRATAHRPDCSDCRTCGCQ